MTRDTNTTDEPGADTDETADAGRTAPAPRTDGGRDTISVPDEIEMPRLLDVFELQTPEHTGIHEFYDNLREEEFTTTECGDCGALHFPPRVVCPECHGDDLEYVSLPEEGELYAFTEVRAGAPLGMEEQLPFVVGVVDLGEVRLSARIAGAGMDDLEIGDPVRFSVVDIDGPRDHERVYYQFEPIEAGAE